MFKLLTLTIIWTPSVSQVHLWVVLGINTCQVLQCSFIFNWKNKKRPLKKVKVMLKSENFFVNDYKLNCQIRHPGYTGSSALKLSVSLKNERGEKGVKILLWHQTIKSNVENKINIVNWLWQLRLAIFLATLGLKILHLLWRGVLEKGPQCLSNQEGPHVWGAALDSKNVFKSVSVTKISGFIFFGTFLLS